MRITYGQIELTCEKCGTTFRRRLSYHRHLIEKRGVRGIFCGRRCRADAQMVALGDEIRSQYESGLTLKQVGDIHGVSWGTIRKRLLKMGVTLRPPNRLTSDNNPTKGVGHSESAKQKIRDANRRQFARPGAREQHAALTCKQIAEGRAGKSYNQLETRVASMLEDQGIEYIQQHIVGGFVYDFYLPATNTLLEVHGTFWHADPRFYDREHLSPVQRRNVQNDRSKRARALRDGYQVRVIWEADVP